MLQTVETAFSSAKTATDYKRAKLLASKLSKADAWLVMPALIDAGRRIRGVA